MLSCAGADRLQTGMRGAFGKGQGKVARVKIGQVLFSVRLKESSIKIALEAFRRAKNKFSGRQKVVISRKWGFTKLTRSEYKKLREENNLSYDGLTVRQTSHKGPLSRLALFRNY